MGLSFLGPFLQDIENKIPINIWITIAIALSSGFVAAIGFGMLAPLYALRMDDGGFSNSTIGILLSITGFAPLIFTPYVPWVLAKYKVKNALMFAIGLSATFYIIMYLSPSPFTWTAVRFCFAIVGTFLFVATESWVLEIAPEKYRGRILGVYAIIFYGGIGVGGIFIAIFGYKSDWTLLSAFLLDIAVLPLFLLKTEQATKPHSNQSGHSLILKTFLIAPALFMPAIAVGGLETAAFNLFPIWARRIGFTDEIAGAILTSAAIGNVILQGPLGILADKIGRIKTIWLITLVTFILPIGLMFVSNPIIALILVGIWSGFATGFYTMGLMGIAESYSGQRIASANSTFGMCYCIGQFAAPSIGGAMMQSYGAAALMVCLMAFAVLPIITFAIMGKTETTP